MKLLRVNRHCSEWRPSGRLEEDQDRLAAMSGLDWPVELVCVDDRDMTRLNREYRGKDGVTDVLSFSDLVGQGDGTPLLRAGERGAGTDLWREGPGDAAEAPVGEIVMAPDFIRDRCRRRDWDAEDEIAMLTAHGLLHVLGWEHENEDSTRRMRLLEQEMLAACGRGHPLLGNGRD